MKLIILACLLVPALAVLSGCSDDRERQTTSYQSSSMAVDSKDMHPRHSQPSQQ